MKLAVYYPWLYLTSGAERTILELCRRSRHEITVLTNEYQPENTFPELRDMDVRVLPRVPVERTVSAVGTAAVRILRQRIDLSEYDAMIVVCEGLGDLMTLRHRQVPVFCLCLTPLRIVFDPHYRRRYLEGRGLLDRMLIEAGSAAFKVVDRMAWRRYQRVFAISGEVRDRALAGGLATPEQIRLLHPGVDLSRFRPSTETEKVFFVPGRIMWTKNLELAILAFRRFRERVADPDEWRLHVAGMVDRKSRPYFERLQRLADGDPAIRFLVGLSDAEMLEHYRRSFGVLFTAFNEDWGLVIIEGMACGKPVVATDRGGPREIVRHGHDGLLAAPEPEAFASAMAELANDGALRERIVENAPQSARRFGWDSFIQRIDGLLEDELSHVDGASPRLAPVPGGAA